MSEQTNGKPVKREKLPRPNADEGREPDLLPGHMGARMFSRAALLERIEDQFVGEYGEDSDLLREADTVTKRRRIILDITDYVLSVESVQLEQDEKADLVRQAYSNLFGYGPLDELFADESITTIAIEGPNAIWVRRGAGELTEVTPIFDDDDHLQRVLRRLVMHAGAELRFDQPFIEAGLTVNERPVSINIIAPPMAFTTSVDLRVHPTEQFTLDDLVAAEAMSDQVAEILTTLAKSDYGIIVVGDTESGKTTLLNVLANLLPDSLTNIVSVERSGELRLTEPAEQLKVKWSVRGRPGITFGQQIGEALVKQPDCILLDEVRSDEPDSIEPLLSTSDAPRQLWAFRGVPDAKRLQSSLGMLARRAGVGQGEALVHELYSRLPFVVTLARIRERVQVFSVAEWQPHPESEYCDYVMLTQYRNGMSRPTGARPNKPLDLPDSFWEADEGEPLT